MLRELFLRCGGYFHPLVKKNRAAGGGPLIDGENVFHRNPFDDRLGVTVSDDVGEGSKNLPLGLGYSHRSRLLRLKNCAVFKYQNGVAVIQTHFGYQIKHRPRTCPPHNFPLQSYIARLAPSPFLAMRRQQRI